MVVVGGGGLVPDPPPTTTTPKLQLDLLDLENFLVKVLGGGGGGGCLVPDPPTTTTPKLNWTFLDLEKWLFMPEICDDILLLPAGNYSFHYWPPGLVLGLPNLKSYTEQQSGAFTSTGIKCSTLRTEMLSRVNERIYPHYEGPTKSSYSQSKLNPDSLILYVTWQITVKWTEPREMPWPNMA